MVDVHFGARRRLVFAYEKMIFQNVRGLKNHQKTMPALTRSQAKVARAVAAEELARIEAQLYVESVALLHMVPAFEPAIVYPECAICAEETCEEGLSACEACGQKLCLDCQDRVKSCPFCRFVSALHAQEEETVSEDAISLDDLEWERVN